MKHRTLRSTTTENVAGTVGRALGRLQAIALAVLACAVVAAGALLLVPMRAARHAQELASVASQQPTLALRLALLAPHGDSDTDDDAEFTATLAALQRNHTRLSRAAPREDAALAALYSGTGYNLDSRMRGLFDLAARIPAQPELAAALRREAAGPVPDQLQQAAQWQQAAAEADLAALHDAVLAAGLVLLVLIAALGRFAVRPSQRRLLRVLAALERLAAADPLTGALSRNAFGSRLRRLLQATRQGESLGLVRLELDHFRELNDRMGATAGEAVLRSVARRLRLAAGPGAAVGRLAVDQFAVALPTDSNQPDWLAALAGQLAETIRAPIPFQDRQLQISATLGTAQAPQDSADRSELLRLAALALHEARQQGAGSLRAFRSPDDPTQQRREAVLHALAVGDLTGVTAWLQPLLRCADLQLVGFEALARWEHPTLGPIPPAEFIAIAEASQRLALLSVAVRRAAFAAMAMVQKTLPAGPGALPRLALNLTAGEVARPEVLATLLGDAEAAGLIAGQLQIEVREEALMEPLAGAAVADHHTLAGLQQRGVRLALDDFGLGYASLRHLRQAQVEALKIDRSFVAGIGQDARAEAIVRGIIGLAAGLAIETVAEGVETAAQHAFLRAHGCDVVQGYLFARPMPAAEIIGWLRLRQGGASADIK